MRTFSPKAVDDKGFITVQRTLQIVDGRHPNVYAVGDVRGVPFWLQVLR